MEDLTIRVTNLEDRFGRVENDLSDIKSQIASLTSLMQQFMGQASISVKEAESKNPTEKAELKDPTVRVPFTPHARFNLTGDTPDFGKGLTEREKRRSSNLFADLPVVSDDVKDNNGLSTKGVVYVEPAPTTETKLTKLTVAAVIEWATQVHEYKMNYPESKRTIATMIDKSVIDQLITHWNDPKYTALQFQKASYNDALELIRKKLQARDPVRLRRALCSLKFPNLEMYEKTELNSFTFRKYLADTSASRLSYLHNLNFHITNNPNLESLRIRWELKANSPIQIWLDSLPHQTYVKNVLNDMGAYSATYLSMDDFLSEFMSEMQQDNERAEAAKLLIEKNIPLNVTRSQKAFKQRESSQLHAFFMDEEDLSWPKYALPESQAAYDYFTEYEEVYAMEGNVNSTSTRGCHAKLLKGECTRVKCTYSHEEADLRRLYDEYMKVLLHHRFRNFPSHPTESKPFYDQGSRHKLAMVEQLGEQGSDSEM